MKVWQADFYRRPLQDPQGQPLWELLLCDPEHPHGFSAFCPQSAANAQWLKEQLIIASGSLQELPVTIQVFRPQSVSLFQAAWEALGVTIQPTRRTPALKQWLQERAEQYPLLAGYTNQPYDPIAIDSPPPVPVPENLWGEQWRFATISATDLEGGFRDRPIPIQDMPEELLPSTLKLPGDTPIPGIVIDGGRQSMRLARWLQQAQPYALNFIAGEPDGVILEAGLCDRWVLATFTDPDVRAAATTYETRKQTSQGLHFLLVQPDNSGMTYTGIWLLQREI